MLKGKIFPEGSTIELDEDEALQLSNYLDELKDNVILCGVEGSLITGHKSPITNNSLQKNKRSNK